MCIRKEKKTRSKLKNDIIIHKSWRHIPFLFPLFVRFLLLRAEVAFLLKLLFEFYHFCWCFVFWEVVIHIYYILCALIMWYNIQTLTFFLSLPLVFKLFPQVCFSFHSYCFPKTEKKIINKSSGGIFLCSKSFAYFLVFLFFFFFMFSLCYVNYSMYKFAR